MFKARLRFRAEFECGKVAWLSKTLDLPFVPFDGLEISIGGAYAFTVEYFSWNERDQFFELSGQNQKFQNADFTFAEFSEWLERLGCKVSVFLPIRKDEAAAKLPDGLDIPQS